jgi:hypothetical protein
MLVLRMTAGARLGRLAGHQGRITESYCYAVAYVRELLHVEERRATLENRAQSRLDRFTAENEAGLSDSLCF